MNAAISSIVLLLAMQATTALAAEGIVAGTYVRAGSNSKTSATLKILQASATQATISLEVIAKPSASATTARTGRLNRELLQVSSQTAVYRDTASGTGGCSIKFAFGQHIVRVKQAGQCDQFGVGIEATGRYILRGAGSAAPGNRMGTEHGSPRNDYAGIIWEHYARLPGLSLQAPACCNAKPVRDATGSTT